MATQEIKTITGTLREPSKQSNRALRAEKLVPAVLYGPEISENINFSVDELQLEKLLRRNQTKLQILIVDGKEYKTLLKRTDYAPVTDRPIHVDFYVLSDNHKVTLRIPVKLTGNSKGVVENGGRMFQPMKFVRIRVLPEFIPSEFVVDITPLKVGVSFHVGDLNLEGIDPIDSLSRTIVTIRPPKGALVIEGDEDEEAIADGAEAAEGEETTEE